jgi:choline dehydrogenase-like flavoprotein
MPYDCDVLVVGGGAGGGTFAHACARAGKSVLLLERGGRPVSHGLAHDEQATLIDKKPYDDRLFEVNGKSRRLYMGGVLGGGTSLYGSALLRPSHEDFHPGRQYGPRLPRSIWDWPISYDDLEAHYTTAEHLYGVAGCADDDFGPLRKPRHGFVGPPLPLRPINEHLIAANRSRGLRPFRLPLAIDTHRCLSCDACAGYVCPNGSRHSSAQLVDGDIAEGLSLTVRTNVEAEYFLLDGAGRIDGVTVKDRVTGARSVLRARRYALAAGAIGSPLLLLRSGVGGTLVGRHYMTHLSPIVAGIFRRRTEADVTFVKQVGFADYYLGTKTYPHKLGLVQSLPVPGPLLSAKMAPRFLPRRFVQFLRQRMLPLAGIIEDLPDPVNRVFWGSDGRPRLQHRFTLYDVERGKQLARLMKRILRAAGAVFSLYRPFPSVEHVAHQCGTLRFGTDPAHAVADADCRVFGQPNLFVVDGSVFPTSLGVGPALTIMANALRVAAVVVREV